MSIYATLFALVAVAAEPALPAASASEAHPTTANTVPEARYNRLPDAPELAERYQVDAGTGYRMQRYRAPVPDSLPGADTLDTTAALELFEAGEAVFIDVYAPRGAGYDPLDGHWLLAEQRQSLPRSLWLPEVGRGYLEADRERWFLDNLHALSGGQQDTELVFFCIADCWQGWNAALRAVRAGYRNVAWYPLGSDGWREHGLPLDLIEPLNAFSVVPLRERAQ